MIATLASDDDYLGATSAPVEFTISKATNGWTYGDAPATASVRFTFGEPRFLYSDRANGTYTETAPTNAGTWYVKAVIAGTDNYESLESNAVPFAIAPKGVTSDSQITVPEITADTNPDELTIKDVDKVLVQGIDYDVTRRRTATKWL